MTRGRKKDLTIPPSRALTQQRDYRARKALYLSQLENRCQRLQEKNERLQAEVAALRAGISVASPPDPQLTEASSELMDSLESTKRALDKFQSLAYKVEESQRPSTSRAPTPPFGASARTPSLRPACFPSPEPSEGSFWTPSPLQQTDDSQSGSESSWQEEQYRPPESLRKILCSPSAQSSPSLSLRSIHIRESPSRSSDQDARGLGPS
ncbi:hypothetical protein E1B28_003915 [Marasmius oreades]|uniref:BZIP domain-containing protein n=1 Tax=Marasmius oreades TaxID=181124 RepID=A0A9P7UXM7_9AGAR|nr:uncharacterized protein E1B28_003915 [Marasmius oreades]KAG7096485.1 hypothetical protein E1B28_003915 [Marasmius oreades]